MAVVITGACSHQRLLRGYRQERTLYSGVSHSTPKTGCTSLDFASFVGSAATCASVVSFFPQALKIARTRETSGISTKMYAITVAGFAMWMAYGILLAAYPLIIANGLCLLLSGFILVMKLVSSGPKSRMAEQTDTAV